MVDNEILRREFGEQRKENKRSVIYLDGMCSNMFEQGSSERQYIASYHSFSYKE